MHFTEEGVQLFHELFKKHKIAMASVSGCQSLELFNDLDKQNSVATISKWQSVEHLEAYRNSELFTTIWKKIKPHFAEKAEAFSLAELN
jgi:hypothetical protein